MHYIAVQLLRHPYRSIFKQSFHDRELHCIVRVRVCVRAHKHSLVSQGQLSAKINRSRQRLCPVGSSRTAEKATFYRHFSVERLPRLHCVRVCCQSREAFKNGQHMMLVVCFYCAIQLIGNFNCVDFLSWPHFILKENQILHFNRGV